MEKMNETVSSLNGYTYPLIKGENYNCVPTCLRMVFAAMGYKIDEAKLLTWFSVNTPETADNPRLYGIQVRNGDLDNIFSKLDIPVREQYVPISHIIDYQFGDVIHRLLTEGKHVMCGYSYGSLFGMPDLKDIGHVSIIIGNDDRFVTIINPGPDNYGINIVKEDDLYTAIRVRNDGLWILARIDNTRKIL